MKRGIYVGFDPKEAAAFWVTVQSVKRRLSEEIPVYGLELESLRHFGFYTRPTRITANGKLYDDISQHEMSTEFACSRFLVPYIAQTGWALFMDCDMLVLDDLTKLFHQADPRYAIMCVKHNHNPTTTEKMDGAVQSRYHRKNWSSLCLFNCDHPSNKALTLELVNSVPGRDLHAFCWLKDEEIGELEPRYNTLVGYQTLYRGQGGVLHYTEGGPWFKGKEDTPYAKQWFNELRSIVRNGPL